ncbi:hypothetical protein P43SY_005679 [Pythium insidiosum]|uniref:Uncharacterized protein n=1 Tax=Pythium insidiosum TaxID=114742 RepID=A0AAD5Q853_PYTIN|nr:hypothetical protein P43SY_005679 [Pythium insidiosum]
MRRSPRHRARDDETDAPTAAKRTKRGSNGADPVEVAGDGVAWLDASALSVAKVSEWSEFFGKHCSLLPPTEFFDLFALATHLHASDPLNAFVGTLGLRLTGPFELLSRTGEKLAVHKPLYLHGRFALDVPEIVSVIEDTASATGAHWGLFRSECKFEPVASSLFALLSQRVQERLATKKTDPALAQLSRTVNAYLKLKNTPDAELAPTAIRSRRDREVTAKSLHGLGIVVPYDAKKRCGFRDLPITGTALRDLLQRSAAASARKKVNELITRATIANDECDFGTGLLLGLDLFTTGAAFQKEALQQLRVSYMLLGRKEFASVASALVKHRDLDRRQHLNCLVGGEATDAPTDVTLP